MLKTSFSLAAVLLLVSELCSAQTASMAQRMASCTGSCHGPGLIAQQRLNRNAWNREVDKMIGWGAAVPPSEKDALVNYLATLFNPSRPRPNTSKAVPEGKGKDIFQSTCMSCHDDKPMAALKLNRAGWAAEVEKMMSWGAYVPAGRKEDLIEYLVSAFSDKEK